MKFPTYPNGRCYQCGGAIDHGKVCLVNSDHVTRDPFPKRGNK